MEYVASSYYLLPEEPGIYLFLDEKGSILYVGKAKNLKKRVSSYFQKTVSLIGKTKLLIEQVRKIKIIRVESEIESLLLEANYIKKYIPKFNINLKDGKAYPLIKITTEPLPKVLTVRKIDDPKSLYFGPYPNAGDMRMVLRIIRHIFPFISASHVGNRVCLYNHLGLCPCPATLKTVQEIRNYRKTIFYIVKFLQGKSKKVLQELEKERGKKVKEEAFEKAHDIQKKIDAIVSITSQRYKPFEYEQNPNFKEDLRNQETKDLREVLKKAGTETSILSRIECYDISNISGMYATGSLVVFTNGEKDSKWYRRFKIRLPQKTGSPNDFAMIEEVLTRRLTHSEWPSPDLIIVDGGKGQISSALKALDRNNLNIPLVGLAKREETIITSDFKEISLPKNSHALKLMMRIRNEAHRFAITYHRKLRSKLSLS